MSSLYAASTTRAANANLGRNLLRGSLGGGDDDDDGSAVYIRRGDADDGDVQAKGAGGGSKPAAGGNVNPPNPSPSAPPVARARVAPGAVPGFEQFPPAVVVPQPAQQPQQQLLQTNFGPMYPGMRDPGMQYIPQQNQNYIPQATAIPNQFYPQMQSIPQQQAYFQQGQQQQLQQQPYPQSTIPQAQFYGQQVPQQPYPAANAYMPPPQVRW